MEITVNNLSHSYNKEKDINNINFKLQKYKINTIIGPSGSGKTTLAKLISGLLKPTEGNIKVDEYIISKQSKKRDLSNLKYQIEFIPSVNGIEFYKKTVIEELNHKLENIKIVNLDEYFLNENPQNLNSNNKLKLALARALIYSPEVIVFDNPFARLDHKNQKEIISIIKALKKDYRKTIIVISNDIDTIHIFSDYIYVMDKGNIILEGTKYDVFKEEKFLNDHNIKVPKIIEFSNYVHETKNIKMGYRDQINDLLKDIYRYVK